MRFALRLGKELLDRRKDDAARRDLKVLPQIRSVLVRPGEVVYVTPKSTNAAWAAFTQTLAVSRDILNIALAVDVIKRDSHNP